MAVAVTGDSDTPGDGDDGGELTVFRTQPSDTKELLSDLLICKSRELLLENCVCMFVGCRLTTQSNITILDSDI